MKKKNPRKKKEMAIEDLAMITKRGFDSVDKKVEYLKTEMNERFDSVDERFNGVDKRLDKIEDIKSSAEISNQVYLNKI